MNPIAKKLHKIEKLANRTYRNCIGIGSLSKIKDGMSEITKILKTLKGDRWWPQNK